LFFSRFLVQELCAAATYISGFLRIRLRIFLMAIIPGELIYGTAFPLLGFVFRETWSDYTNIFSDVTILLLLLIAAYFLMSWFIKNYRIRHNKI